MSNYVFGTSLSYIDYLQARSFETSFKSELSRQTRSIIASNAELRKHHIEIIEKVSSGVEQLSFDVQALSGEVSELNATFQWGFSELLTSLGRVNDSLAELVKISKTPAQTWAYEQFEIARDAFRQGLFDEALEYLDRAINGYSGNTGYKLEYRFHYLLGTIRMGSFQNTSSDVVNLAESELAFLSAAKYARRDHPEEAGRALLGAGWAAYCQGKMADATRYTDQTLVLIPDLAEGHFQRAKIQMHIDHCDSSLSSLKRAIEIDRGIRSEPLETTTSSGTMPKYTLSWTHFARTPKQRPRHCWWLPNIKRRTPKGCTCRSFFYNSMSISALPSTLSPRPRAPRVSVRTSDIWTLCRSARRPD